MVKGFNEILSATVEFMPKRTKIWGPELMDKRRLVVSIGKHEFDLVVPEEEFEAALQEAENGN